MKAQIDFTHPGLPEERHAFSQAKRVLRADRLDQVRPLLDEISAACRDGAWAVGFVAYEAAPAFDSALPVMAPDTSLPLACFAIFDAPQPAVAAAPPAGHFAVTPWSCDLDRSNFEAQVASIRTGIAAGDYYQINLTARHKVQFSGDRAALYAALRAAQPESFGLYLEAGALAIASVSPELFFDWSGDRLRVRPMKGTATRSADPHDDAAAAATLAASDKERAENLMIVDLLRNDLSRVACTGSVQTPRLFELEALPTAWQMTSTITCKTLPQTTLADVFGALFPCGSITGAPKRAAMQTICALETTPRGIYCGALGLVRPGGHASFSVGIRSVVVQGDHARCGIGSGITLDSSADGEWAEWAIKRRFLWRATAPFELLETLRLVDGVFARRTGHRDRLLASARHFGFALTADAVDAQLAQVAREHPAGRFRIRLLAARDGTVRAQAYAWADEHAAAATEAPAWPVVLAAQPIDAERKIGPDLLAHKTTERAHYPSPPEGAMDVLLWNRAGRITEFTRGNLIYQWQGCRYTPPADGTLLPGVLRGELLARGDVTERALTKAELPHCEGLWFINSLRGERPVVVK